MPQCHNNNKNGAFDHINRSFNYINFLHWWTYSDSFPCGVAVSNLHLFCFHSFVLTTSLPLLHCLASTVSLLTSLICIKTEYVGVRACVCQSKLSKTDSQKRDNDCVTIFVSCSSEILRRVIVETKVICSFCILSLKLRQTLPPLWGFIDEINQYQSFTDWPWFSFIGTFI